MKTTTLIFLFLSSILNLSAQNDWYTQIDINSPVYQQYARGALYDDDGALWISYYNGGIGKYYNNNYTVYCDTSNFVDLCKGDNNIYAASNDGVYKYDGNSWNVFLDTSNGLKSNYVNGIVYNNNKLYIRNDSVLNIYDTQTSLFNYIDINVYINYSDTTFEGEFIYRYYKRAVTVYNNNVYIGDTNCVYVLNNDIIIDTILIEEENVMGIISDIQFTNSGQMYTILSDAKLYMYEGNELVNVKYHYNFLDGENLSINNLRNILIVNDTIYIAGSVLFKFFNNDYKVYNEYDVYSSLEGYLFVNEDNKICLLNNSSDYKIFNFSNYHNVHDITNDSYKFLDINNVNAGFGQSDLMFWGFDHNAKYEVPKGSGKHSMFTGGLWIGGYDDNGELHLAGTKFQDGYDYFPGPLNNNAETDSTVSYSYNKVWKINRLEIEEVQYRYQHGMLNQVGYEIPDDILSWPANGNTSLGYAQNIAPYYDANGDNLYNVYDGDYPIIKGDQQIFSLFNDNLAEHGETKGRALGIEIQTSFYAYYTCADTTDSTSAINNTTFLHYKITNKSDTTYNNVYAGYFSDADIGDATDDLIGSNVELKSFYFYNADIMDGDGTGRTYGYNPPKQSITYLKGISADNADGLDNNNNGQIDEVSETCDFNHFVYYNNSLSAGNGDPTNYIEFYNYLKSIWRDSTHMKFGGDGYSTATDTIAEYMFPGESDPNNYGTHGINPGFIWTGANSDIPDDKRGVASMGPFTLEAGEEIEFELALVWSRDSAYNVMGDLFRDIENVKYWYDNNINLSCLELDTATIGISELPEDNLLKIYPNPVKDKLFVDYTNDNAKCKITDINGKVIFERNLNGNITEINTSKYAKGVYVITISDNNKTISRKFVK